MSPRRPLARIDEVASYLGVPVSTIYDQRHRRVGVGALGIKVGRHLRFRWDDVDSWVAEQAGEQVASSMAANGK